MIGAIAGDIIGSTHEWSPRKITEFELFTDGSHFTDDSVLTIAVAAAILEGRDSGSRGNKGSASRCARGVPRTDW